MSAHTPGPWETRKAIALGDIAIIAPSQLSDYGKPAIVAECYDEIRREREGAVAECEANARLIAAAPELLAIVERYLHTADKPLGISELADIDAEALAVIAKARGES